MNFEAFLRRASVFLTEVDKEQALSIFSGNADLCLEWLEASVCADGFGREFYSLSTFVALTESCVATLPRPTPTVRLGR
jgi:hypothetical protein